MSKESSNLYNPFAKIKLDSKKSDQSKEKKNIVSSPKKIKKTEAPKVEDPEFEAENNLFLTQMAKVRKIPNTKNEANKYYNHEQNQDYSNFDFNLSEILNTKQEKNTSKAEQKEKLQEKSKPDQKPQTEKKEIFIFSKEQKAEELAQLDNADEFLNLMSDVKSLHKKGRDVLPEVKPEVSTLPKNSNPLQDFMEGKLEFSVHSTDQYVEGHVLGLDLMTLAKLQARQYSPEAHIDLHGLNSEQAYNNLIAFFRNSYHRGLRTVLVVTGKGRNSFDGTPVLRAKIQEWFTKEPFKRVVIAFCSAKIEDGGAGALYVLIRKRKKEYGKIQWDMNPVDPDLYL